MAADGGKRFGQGSRDLHLKPVLLENRVARLEQQLAKQHRAAPDPIEADTNGSAAAGEESAEQPAEEEPSALPNAGPPVEGTEDGLEDCGERIAEEEEN